MSGETWHDRPSLHLNGKDPCNKGGASKWILPFDSNGWQRLDEPHQWEMAETLLCLGRRVMRLSLSFTFPFVLLKKRKGLYVSFTFPFFSFFSSSDYVTRQSCDMFS